MRKKPNLTSGPPKPTPKTPRQLEQWAAYEKITADRAILKSADEKERGELAAIKVKDAQALHDTLFQSMDLLSEAKRWAAADSIRTYIREVLRVAPSPVSPNLREWAEQSLKTANALDPVAARIGKCLPDESNADNQT